MREGHRALRHEGGGRRQVEPFDECHHRVGGALADDAVTHQYQRRLGRVDQARDLLHLGLRRARYRRRLHLERRETLGRHPRDVLRHLDEARAGLFRLGHLERLAHHFGHDLRFQHLGAELGAMPEQGGQIQHLMALLVHAGRRRLPGDGHQRRAVHVGVGHAGDQVGGAGPQGGQAHAGTAREPAVHVGHEGRALLVARGDEADAALRERIHDVDVLFARDAEDVVHALVFQAAHQELGGVHARGHPVTRCRCRRRRGAR